MVGKGLRRVTEKSVGTLSAGEAGGKTQTCPAGIGEGSSERATKPKAELKCLYGNACSMGKKQEELETVVQPGKVQPDCCRGGIGIL